MNTTHHPEPGFLMRNRMVLSALLLCAAAGYYIFEMDRESKLNESRRLTQLAEVYLKKGEKEAAVKSANVALKIHPENAEARRLVATVELEEASSQ
jgi:Tfp pilus assembly protein PilF